MEIKNEKGDVLGYRYVPGHTQEVEVIGSASTATPFLKGDMGKLRWDLLPLAPIEQVLRVLALGATKYSDHNWRTGANWSRYYNAAMRHLSAYWQGEICDPETGESHLAHALCCLLFLAEYEAKGIGTDDRLRSGARYGS